MFCWINFQANRKECSKRYYKGLRSVIIGEKGSAGPQ